VLLLVAAAVDPVYQRGNDQTDTDLDNYTNLNIKNSSDKIYNNIAITRFQSRLSFVDLSCYELFIELCNFGDTIVETRLKIFVGDLATDVISVLLNPYEVKPYFINGEISQARILDTKDTNGDIGLIVRGEIDVHDSFEADNVAYTILPPPMLRKILYFGEDNFFLINALKSCLPSSQHQTKFERIMKIPDVVPLNSVLVINRNIPPKLPVGNLMIFEPQNGCDLFGVDGLFSAPLVIGFESGNSQLIKFTQFQGKELSGVSKLNLQKLYNNKTPEILLATVENYPVYLSWNFRNQNTSTNIDSITQTTNSESALSRILVFNADISRGDLVLQTSFPILVGNMLNYFRGTDNEPIRNYCVGERVTLRKEITSDWVMIKSPSGKSKILPVHADSNSAKRTVYINKLIEIGVYEIFEITDNDMKSIESDKSIRLIDRLACNFDRGKEKFADDGQVSTATPEKSVLRIHANNQQSIYDTNNFQLWFLFTICALFLMICDWHISRRI
jgi:hypothetical protein